MERFGWGGFFTTLAFLSLNLGIFNLLPIPVLDGGAIFLLLIEGALALVGYETFNASARQNSAGGFCHGAALDGLCDHQRHFETGFNLARRKHSTGGGHAGEIGRFNVATFKKFRVQTLVCVG